MRYECRLHPHAKERLSERGATEEEIITAIETGETFPAKFGRTGFRRNFAFGELWKVEFMLPNKSKSMPLKKMMTGLPLRLSPDSSKGRLR
jgi:alkylhydroperoxidase/carboxymuconolactone decarboxylase family protein YurZ